MLDQIKSKKSQGFFKQFKESFFCLYDQIVSSFILNGFGLIAFVVIETLILLHTLLIIHKLATGYFLDSLYEYLQYINVHTNSNTLACLSDIFYVNSYVHQCLLFRSRFCSVSITNSPNSCAMEGWQKNSLLHRLFLRS